MIFKCIKAAEGRRMRHQSSVPSAPRCPVVETGPEGDFD